MKVINRVLHRSLNVVLIVALLATLVSAQQNRGTLRGLVADEFGAAIVGATVTLIDGTGAQKILLRMVRAFIPLPLWPRGSISSRQLLRASQLRMLWKWTSLAVRVRRSTSH